MLGRCGGRRRRGLAWVVELPCGLVGCLEGKSRVVALSLLCFRWLGIFATDDARSVRRERVDYVITRDNTRGVSQSHLSMGNVHYES